VKSAQSVVYSSLLTSTRAALIKYFSMEAQPVTGLLQKYAAGFHPVVKYTAADTLLSLNLTEANTVLIPAIYSNTEVFSNYISQLLQNMQCRFAVGGYNELRVIYAASPHFDAKDEPRRLHLGIDIWGPAGTPVYACLGGRVHSFAFNGNKADYGATLVLQHQLEGTSFHTLYGHISKKDIAGLTEAQYMVRGQQIAHFGMPEENGQWPPHLHFQVIIDMQLNHGDYPGVCKFSERAQYLANCPDPDLILQLREKAQVV
jgi:peptidoglycan LD-endopeptidase LytH